MPAILRSQNIPRGILPESVNLFALIVCRIGVPHREWEIENAAWHDSKERTTNDHVLSDDEPTLTQIRQPDPTLPTFIPRAKSAA